jgi:hypothetical protein
MTTGRDSAGTIAKALAPHLPLGLGSLRVWGDWFGKALDNMHILVGARHEGDELILEFHHREVLRVWQPGGWTVDETASSPNPRLVIRSAERVGWGWYYYGRPELPENWFEILHWREAGGVRASTTASGFAPIFAPSIEEPAVTFL